MPFLAVVAAAGKSSRFGGIKKEYRLLHGKPVLAHSLSLFLDHDDCVLCVAVVPPGGVPDARAALGHGFMARYGGRLLFAEGGTERADSVLAGLRALEAAGADPEQLVLVHDGARPFASAALLSRVLDGCAETGACVPGVPVTDTIKRVDAAGFVVEHPPRAFLRAVQTPQGFRFRELLDAYLRLGPARTEATDDAELWSRAGRSLMLAEGERSNVKITFPEDLP